MRPSAIPRKLRRPLRLLCVVCYGLALLAPTTARAHFLWLTNDRESKAPSVHAFLSETPVPEGPEFLKHIAKAKITAGGQTLSWTKGEDTYRVTLPVPAPKILDGLCDLGIMSRADVKFRLLYTARLQFGPSPPGEAEAGDHLRVRLVSRPGQAPIIEVRFRGKPAAQAVVKAFPENGDPVELKTDAEGRLEYAGIADGRVGLLAKWAEKTPGEVDGKPYDEVRYYATLTVAPGDTTGAGLKKAGTPAKPSAPFALLPEAINSFGGAVLGDWLYVYSGHIGQTHKYHETTTTKHFRRLNLKDRTTWEELPPGPALQGVALVAHGKGLYRIGGMSAKNKPDKPNDLVSVAGFARFDPETKTWTDLPPLPSPRSTHDAVVLDDKIYVIGGWSMNGGGAENAEFQADALTFDLSRDGARWETLATPPFRRRALAAAATGGKVYVLGGLSEDGKVVKSVDIYDSAQRTWSRGPELPGSQFQGFAPSAFGVGGRLYVSGHDGLVHRLSAAGDVWEVAGRLAVPRLTHRLLPGIGGDLLVVGGNFAGSPTRLIESIPLDRFESGPRAVAWSVPYRGEARQGQAMGFVRSRLLIAGGNRSGDPHAFAPQNLTTEASEIGLNTVESQPLAPLPEPRQSATLLVPPEGDRAAAYLLGGIGPDGDASRTRGDVFRFDDESRKWSKLTASIGDNRGMFGAAFYKDAIWVFGGSVFDPRPGRATPAMPADILRWEPDREAATFKATGHHLPRGRRSFAGAVLNAKYYLVGGLGEDRKPVETVDVFEFEGGQWSTILAPAHPRLFSELAALGGKLYLCGGFIPSSEHHFEPAASIEVYDPATARWTTLLDELPVPVGHVHMFPIYNRLLLFAVDSEKTDQGHMAIVLP
jgi:N-acetylneuraminic acid mutarotase